MPEETCGHINGAFCDGMVITTTAAHHFIWRHLYASMQAAQTPTSKLGSVTPDKESTSRTRSPSKDLNHDSTCIPFDIDFLWPQMYTFNRIICFDPLSTLGNKTLPKRPEQHREHIQLPAKLLDYFLPGNKSNINHIFREVAMFQATTCRAPICKAQGGTPDPLGDHPLSRETGRDHAGHVGCTACISIVTVENDSCYQS